MTLAHLVMHSTNPDAQSELRARRRGGREGRTPEIQFLLVALLNAGLLLAAVIGLVPEVLPGGPQAPLALFAVVTAASAAGLRRHYPHSQLGLCNVVTHFRATLAALLAAPLLAPESLLASPVASWTVAGIAAAAFALDGLDGWLARRSGLISPFGARFDVEVDALLAVILALLAWQSGKAGGWILVLGLLRYGFVLAGMALPWLAARLPERLRRKAVCVVQIAALILLQTPLLQPPASAVLAAAVAALLVWSFAVDLFWLARRRHCA
jgi:phosphatidylglycerophosphate synthase